MSRSYRKPYYVDSYGSKSKKISKRFANKAVRNADDVPNGKAYKKFSDSWDIVDWKSRWDPKPHYYYDWKGNMVEVTGDPEWKARRK